MKNNQLQILSVMIIVSTLLTSCEVIADIFKAGVWVGILIVVGIIALVVWLVGKAKK